VRPGRVVGRIGHIYPIRRRVGHIYLLRGEGAGGREGKGFPEAVVRG
jgi:hypothetical protein